MTKQRGLMPLPSPGSLASIVAFGFLASTLALPGLAISLAAWTWRRVGR